MKAMESATNSSLCNFNKKTFKEIEKHKFKKLIEQ